MAGFDFDTALGILFFMLSVWSVGRLFARFKLPPLVGQMLVGVILGPNCFDFVPYASDGRCTGFSPAFVAPLDPYANATALGPCSGSGSGSGSGRMLSAVDPFAGSKATCTWTMWERWYEGAHLTSIWVFAGNLGVTLMIFESGMHIHFDKVAAVGKKALVVAIFGTLLPIVFGWLAVFLIFTGLFPEYAFFPWGFSAGCAFAPTSVGISINMLEEAKMLGSMAGQTTLTAAFIDDVFSLVTLVILGKLAAGSVTAIDIIIPIVVSFGFLGLSVWLAIRVFPAVPRVILNRIPLKKNVSIQDRDQVHLLLMFMTLAFFGWFTNVKKIGGTKFINPTDGTGVSFIGSHLLGAFAAGMAWVNVPRSHAIWLAQLKRIVKWLMRIFFACTVGFAVPVSEFASFTAWWRGIVLGLGPCIGMKLVSGIFAFVPYKDEESKQLAKQASWATKFLQPQQMLVGIAMVARGEFAYLVAEMAKSLRYEGAPEGETVYMMSSEVYAAVIIALVMATVVSPVLFRWALAVFDRATPMHRSSYIGGERKEFAQRAFVIHLAGQYTPGVQREIFSTLHASGVDIIEAKLATVREDDSPDADISQFVNNFTVCARGKKKDFDDDKLEEMQHSLAEVLNSHDASVIFEPADEDFSSDGIIEVQMLGEHHPALLHETTDTLSEMGLDVIKASVHHSHQPGHAPAPPKKPDHSNNTSPGASRSGTPALNRLSRSFGAPAGAPAAPAVAEDSGRPSNVDVARHSNAESLAEISISVLSKAKKGGALFYSATGLKKKTSTTDEAAHGHEHHKDLDIGRTVFYARESDGSKATSAKRRHEIKVALHGLLETHELHGEVLVRLLHESEMALAHSVPRLDPQTKKTITIVKCVGKHHKELLHEICDQFDEQGCDVVHGDIDTDTSGQEVDVFYIHKRDLTALSADERALMKDAINALYISHKVEGHVSIEQAESFSPPVSPLTKAVSGPHVRRGTLAGRDWKLAGALSP